MPGSLTCMLLVCVLPGVSGICKFPTSLLGGSWLMSRSGARLTFNQSDVNGLYLHDSLDIKPPIGKQYDCVAGTDNRYVIRGRKPSTIRKPRFVFICLHILDITPNIVTFVQASITGPGIKPLFTKFDTIASVGHNVVEHVCDLPMPYHPSRHHVLVKEGSTFQQSCPDLIQGAWRSRGLCATSMDVCDGTRIKIHYQNIDSCARTAPFFQDSTPSQCIVSLEDTNYTYLTVYNKNARVPFVCAVLKRKGEIIYMSHRPRECSSVQTPTEGDGIFDFKKYVAGGCEELKPKIPKPLKSEAPTTTSNSSNIFIMAVVGLMLTLLYKCTMRKRRTLKNFIMHLVFPGRKTSTKKDWRSK